MLVLHVLSIWFLSVSSAPYAFVVPLVVLLGPAAVWGVPLGATFAEVLLGGLQVYPLITCIVLFLSAILARVFWVALPSTYRTSRVRAGVAILPVALVVTLVGIGIALVAPAILGMLGVATRLPVYLIERLVPAIVFAPLLVGSGWQWRSPVPTRRQYSSLLHWSGLTVATGVIAVAWVMGTVFFDLIRRDVQAFPHLGEVLTGVLPAVVAEAAAFALGSRGWSVYLIGSVFAFGLVVLVFYWWTRKPTISESTRA